MFLTYIFYLFIYTFRNLDEFFILLSIYSYFSIFNIYWVPYYIFNFLFYNYIGLGIEIISFSMYIVYLAKNIIFFLFKFFIHTIFSFSYFHLKKVYKNENKVWLHFTSIFSIYYKSKSTIFLFVLRIFTFKHITSVIRFLCHMFSIGWGYIYYILFFTRFILFNLKDFIISIHTIYNILIRFIFSLGYYKLLLINSVFKTVYLFSGFSYIDQDIILVKVKNLVRFVINFLNLVNFLTRLTFGTGLHSSNYFLFNKKGFNGTLCKTMFGKTQRFYSHSSKSDS